MKYVAFTCGQDLNKPNDGVLTDLYWPGRGLFEIQYYEPNASCANRVTIPFSKTIKTKSMLMRARAAVCESTARAIQNA